MDEKDEGGAMKPLVFVLVAIIIIGWLAYLDHHLVTLVRGIFIGLVLFTALAWLDHRAKEE